MKRAVLSLTVLSGLFVLASCGEANDSNPKEEVKEQIEDTPKTDPKTEDPVIDSKPEDPVVDNPVIDDPVIDNPVIDESKIITFYNTASDFQMASLNVAKEIFEKINEGWQVNIVNGFNFDSLKSSLTSMIICNQQPSLAYCYPEHVASYLKSDKVLDLEPFIKSEEYGYSEEEWNDFSPAYKEEGYKYGQEGYFSIPFVKSNVVMYYNKTVLENNGIDVPTTWQSLFKACQQLKNIYPKSTPLHFDSESDYVLAYFEQYAQNEGLGKKYYTDGSLEGENKVLFDNEFFLNFLKTANTSSQAGLMTTKSISGSYGSTYFTSYLACDDEDDDAYKAKFTGSFFSVSQSTSVNREDPSSYYEKPGFEAGVTTLPGINSSKSITVTHGPSLVMFDQGDDEKAIKTWEFTKLLLDPVFQAYFSVETNYSPVRKSAYNTDVFKSFVGRLDDKTLLKKIISVNETIGKNGLVYNPDAFYGSNVAYTQVGEALSKAMKASNNDDATIQAFIDEAYENAIYYVRKN